MKTPIITRLTGVSHQTIGNWKRHKPELFAAVLLGCQQLVDKEEAEKELTDKEKPKQ